MFDFLRFAWIALALTPLIITGVRHAKGDVATTRPQRAFLRAGAVTAALLAVMVVIEVAIFFYIEQAWFSALSASSRFWTEYGARVAIGVGVFLISAAIARPFLGGAARALAGTKSRSFDLWIASVVIGGIRGAQCHRDVERGTPLSQPGTNRDRGPRLRAPAGILPLHAPVC